MQPKSFITKELQGPLDFFGPVHQNSEEMRRVAKYIFEEHHFVGSGVYGKVYAPNKPHPSNYVRKVGECEYDRYTAYAEWVLREKMADKYPCFPRIKMQYWLPVTSARNGTYRPVTKMERLVHVPDEVRDANHQAFRILSVAVCNREIPGSGAGRVLVEAFGREVTDGYFAFLHALIDGVFDNTYPETIRTPNGLVTMPASLMGGGFAHADIDGRNVMFRPSTQTIVFTDPLAGR